MSHAHVSLLLICAVLFGTLWNSAVDALSSTTATSAHKVYLPAVTNSRTPPPPPSNADGAFFFEPQTRTTSSNVAVDAQGGTHVVYYYDISENAGGANVVYSYCPAPASNCVKESGWQRVRLFGPVREVQLRLTRDGEPRILAGMVEVGTYGGLFMNYTYAECNQNCLNGANWKSVKVDSVRMSYFAEPRETPRRYFALNRLDQPFFVATDNGSNVSDSSRYGSFLFGCKANCTTQANWTATRFTAKEPDHLYAAALHNAVLKFTTTNQPRIFGEYYPASSYPGDITQSAYFACDSACDQSTSWKFALLTPRGQGPKPAWDMELDAQNRVRVVVYHEDTGDERANRLFYFTCDANCTSAAAWTPVNLELGANIGLGADLALDAAGNPRIAHLASNSVLVYSWCEGSCTDQAEWQHGVAEKPEALSADDVVVIPTRCLAGIWDNYGVNLALDPQGAPRISYDATYQAVCSGRFEEVAHLIRMYFTTTQTGEPTSVEVEQANDEESSSPILKQNYPNPFNPATTITYHVAEPSDVRLVVHDLLGREVAVLVDEYHVAGRYEVTFNASGLGSGVHLYTLQAGNFTQTRRLVLLK